MRFSFSQQYAACRGLGSLVICVYVDRTNMLGTATQGVFKMPDIVDTRGLSCPQPVLLALSKMRELENGEIEVLVDTEVSRENVTRAAARQGWEVAQVEEEAQEYHILLKR